MKAITTILLLSFFYFTCDSQSLFHEDFENPDSVVSSGSIGFAQCTRLAAGGNACDSSSYGVGDSCYLTTVSFSTVGNSTVILSFNQIAKIDFFDAGIIQVSNDSGISWIQLTGGQYLSNSNFQNQGNKFSEATYPTWQPGYAILPDNSWWKPDVFDISTLVANAANVIIRFKLIDYNGNGMNGRTGWYIDNIKVDTSYVSASLQVSNYSTLCGVPQLVNFYTSIVALGYSPTDSLLINLNFGDGSDTSYYIFPGTSPLILNHFYVNSGGYNAILTVADQNSNSWSFSTAFLVYGSLGCSTITGQVYVDQNSNCIYDAGDYPLSSNKLSLDSAGVVYGYAFTDSSGNYTFNVPDTGSYKIILNTHTLNTQNICPATDTIFVSSLPSPNNDYAFSCSPGYDVIVIGEYGWGRFIDAVTYNKQCEAVTGDFKIIFDNKQVFFYATPLGYTLSGDTVTWPSVQFLPNNYHKFKVRLLDGPNVNIGDTLCTTFIADNLPADMVPLNNIDTKCSLATYSFDPNFKEVSPPYEIDTNTTLDYTIHFQNTGTDTAFKIIITDTLDANLDISTLAINGGSHNFSANVYPGRLLVFTFNPIQLPDSSHNQLESNGYVSYSIKVKSGTAIGTHIYNNSYIFFDANQPVITNTTDNLIVTSTLVAEIKEDDEIKIFPNPVTDQITVESNVPVTGLKIQSILGQTVYSDKNNSKNETVIPLNNLRKGIYTLMITTKNRIFMKRIFKI